MAGFSTPVVTASMTAAGAAGYITVNDNSKFIPNAEAWLNHASTITNVIITDLLGSNQIGVKIKPGSIRDATTAVTGPSYGKMDTTSFVVGDTITMPAQFVADASAPVAPSVVLAADVTSTANTLNDTGTIDVSSYSSLAIMVTVSGGTEGTCTMYWVDDAGTSIQAGAVTTPAVNAQKSWGLGGTNGINGALPRRVRLTSGAAGIGNTSRILVYGRK